MLVCDCAFLIAVCIFWGFIFVFNKQLSGLKLIWSEPLDLSEGYHSDINTQWGMEAQGPPHLVLVLLLGATHRSLAGGAGWR